MEGIQIQEGVRPKKKIPCEVYSRVVGYFRPVQNWNKGKRAEFLDRQPYRVPKDLQELPALPIPAA